MSAKYKSPSFLLPNELNTSANTANDTGINSLYSMDFDGSSYIDTGTDTSLSLQGNFTISFWFYAGSFSNGIHVISREDTSSYGWRIQFDAANIALRANSTTQATKYETPVPSTNQWHHLVFTYDGGTHPLCYIDGQSVTLTQGFSTWFAPPNNSYNFRIGKADGFTGFSGKIDEVAVFNRALNTTEIAALYDGTGSNIRPSNLIASNLNPIAYYPLGEQAQMQGYLGNEASSEWQFPNGVLQDYVMDFDGTDYIDAGDIPLEGVYTISFWVNPDASPSSLYFLLDKGDGSSNISTRVTQSSNDTIRFQIGSSNFSSTDTLTNNSWNNVVLIANGSSSKIYINNGTAATGTLTTAANTTQSFFIGTDEGKQSAYYFNGQMSNVVIWNSDQSANIANIYNNGSPQTTYTVTPQNWWKLNATSVYTPSAPNYTTALDFNNNSSSNQKIIQAQNTNALVADSGTISIWAKFASSSVNSLGLIGNGITNSNVRINIYQNSNTVGLAWSTSSSTSFPAAVAITPDKWTHVAVTRNYNGTNTIAKFYINGIEQFTDTLSGAITDKTYNDLLIGNLNDPFNASRYWQGNVSNVALWDSALTASQVSTLFNFGTPETNISFSPINWWKLNNLNSSSSSDGLYDNGSSGINATLYSGSGNPVTVNSTSVAVVPSWKIPTALTIQTPSYTQALDFNNGTGYTDSIAYGSSFSDVPSASGAHTFSLWFKQDALNSNQERLFATKAGHGGIAVWIDNGTLKWSVYDGGSRVVSTSVQAGIWYNIVFGVNGSNETFLYLNNGPKLSTAYSGTIAYQGVETGIYLGRGRDNSPNRSFNGQLSNFAWFNYVLPETGTESVQSIYDLGTPKDITGWSNNYLWYKLNSLTITDSSGNNRTGVNSNATLVSSDVLATQPVNGVSTTLPSTALQQSDLQFDSPYSNYSLKLDVISYVDTNFAIPNWTKYAYSIWFKFNGSTIAGYDHLIGNLSGGGNTMGRAIIGFKGTNLYLNMGDGTNYWYDESQSAAPLLDGSWHHIVLNVYETGQDIYVDGSLLRTYTYTGSVTTGTPATSNNFINKSGSASSNNGVDSSVDEHAVFNRLLTTAEILSIYNNGKPNDISSLSPSYWWRLGENAYFDNNNVTLPNSITGGPNGVSSGTVTSMISADAPGTYANGVGSDLAILDRVGDAPLSTANSQSYNMIPDDKIPYVPGYIGAQTTNNSEMTFDGVDDYFDLGNSTQVQPVKEMTISAWINASSLATYRGIVSCMYNGSSYDGFALRLDDTSSNKIQFVVNSSTQIKSTSTITTGQWYHLVATYDGANIKLYFNGSLESSTSLTGNIDYSDGSRNTIIGSLYPSLFYFTGKIDEVAIFDKALTADQIQFDLYKPSLPAGSNETADIANNPNLPTPVAWYRMGD